MAEQELNILLKELCHQPQEQQWLEFKQNKGSVTNEEIGEYISAMSNGATISNKPFGYMVWGVQDLTHQIVGTNFSFVNAKQGNQDLEIWIRIYYTQKLILKYLNLYTKVKTSPCFVSPQLKANQRIFKRNHLLE